MNRLAKLRATRKEKIAAMRALIDGAAADGEGRDLTAEEQASYDELKAEVDGLDGQISRLSSLDELEASDREPVPAAARGQSGGAATGATAGGQGRNVRAGGPEASREFESLGEFLSAVRFNPNDQRLSALYDENAGANAVDMSAEQRMDTGSAGGFMVPTQFRSEILRVEPGQSIVRPRARVIPAGSPPDAAISIPALDQDGAAPSNIFGGVTVDWIAEGQEKPETEAKLREIKLEPHEVAGHVVITDKLLRNWQAAGSFVGDLFQGAIRQAEDFAFIKGTGAGQPLGYMNSTALIRIPREGANAVSYVDLVNMLSRLLMRGGSPVWIASQGVLPQILNMRDEEGRLIYQTNIREGVGQTLLGYPLIWNNRAAGLGADGDISLVDFSHYLIKDGSGPFVAASEHVLFTQNKTVIKVFWNVDGQPWMRQPFTEENGYTVSPFVTLGLPG